jgi:hypothetical protein
VPIGKVLKTLLLQDFVPCRNAHRVAFTPFNDVRNLPIPTGMNRAWGESMQAQASQEECLAVHSCSGRRIDATCDIGREIAAVEGK